MFPLNDKGPQELCGGLGYISLSIIHSLAIFKNLKIVTLVHSTQESSVINHVINEKHNTHV